MYTGMCSLYLVKSASIVMYGVLRKGNVYTCSYIHMHTDTKKLYNVLR